VSARGNGEVTSPGMEKLLKMIQDKLNNIKDSLAGNLGKICYVETENNKLTGRLIDIRGDELWFKRRNGSIWLVSRKALMALHPVRGE
jgi:hypothetical protein